MKYINKKSGTLYAYTYKKSIDIKKLRADVRAVIKGNYKADIEWSIEK